MKHIRKFSSINEDSKSSKKSEIEDFIEKKKKNTSSYEMYKILRDKGFKESDLEDYFYDNY